MEIIVIFFKITLFLPEAPCLRLFSAHPPGGLCPVEKTGVKSWKKIKIESILKINVDMPGYRMLKGEDYHTGKVRA